MAQRKCRGGDSLQERGGGNQAAASLGGEAEQQAAVEEHSRRRDIDKGPVNLKGRSKTGLVGHISAELPNPWRTGCWHGPSCVSSI